MGYLYLIHAADTRNFKIGFTDVSPENRLKNLQTASPYDLVLLGYREGTKETERKLHQKLYRHHKRGEWFEFVDPTDALYFFGSHQSKPRKFRVRECRPQENPTQKLANRLFKHCFSPLGMTPRLIGKKRWEAPEHSIFYAVAAVAVINDFKPNPDGVRALAMCRDEYWQYPDRYPSLFFDAVLAPDEEQNLPC